MKTVTKENNKKEKGSIYEIPLAQAEAYTKAWAESKTGAIQNGAPTHSGHFIKAFLIDAQELRDILDNRYAGENPSYIRVYFGLDEAEEPSRKEKLVAVPVDEYGVDMIGAHPHLSENSSINSNVYDFTLPCPPTCDNGSALYFGKNKERKN